MRRALRSELLKARTTRTNLWLVLWTTTLMVAIVLLHVFALSKADLGAREGQLMLRGLGTTFGMMFAAMAGAMSITSEIRNGLIRPTLLATPHRSRVIGAKAVASALTGAVVGLAAVATAAIVSAVGLSVRGIPLATTAGDLAQVIVGAVAAAAIWAAIGVAVGALVRSQVGALVGLAVWLLFGETLLIGNVPSVGKYLPGSSAASLAGATLEKTSTYLLAPAVGGVLIAGYLLAVMAAGLLVTSRRDFS